MKPLTSTSKAFGKVMLAAGLLLALICVGILLSSGPTNRTAMLACGINGAVWVIIGVSFYLSYVRCSKRLERLKKEGVCYIAEVMCINQNLQFIRVGSLISGYAVCSYQNNEGKEQHVKSKSFIIRYLTQKQGHKANVYVNPSNPKDYAVEIYIK